MIHDDTLDHLLSPSADDPNSISTTLDPTDQAPDLDMLRRMFRETAQATHEQRRHAEEDRDFYDGPRQIDDASRAKFRRMRLPETYCNKITSAIGATLGLLDSNETSPEAVARNEDDESAATIVTQILRYQADRTDLPNVLRAASENDLVEGICAAKIEIDGNDDCDVSHIPYENFYYDPRSMRYDFKDASYLIHAYWSDVDKVKRKWPDYADQVTCSGFDGDGPEDNPINAHYWVDPSRRRVMIVDNFYIDPKTGDWKRAIYCHSAILEHGPTGYEDDQGNAICPIEALSFHVMREGERRGMVRNLVPIQRKINGFEAAIHKMAISNRVKFSSAAGEANPADRDMARTEAQKTDGAMPQGYDVMGQDGRMMEMAQAVAIMKQEIDDAAPGRAALAQGGANTSGRARQMLQQSGLSELARAFGRWESFEERIYRQMWFRARQFMTDRQMIRVTDDAGVRQSLTINDPVIETQMHPVMSPALDPTTGQAVAGPDGQPIMRQAIHPMTGEPLHTPVPVQTATRNQLAMMDMDVTLKVVQTADTLRGEAKQQLMDWSAKSGISPLNPAFKFLIKFSDIPDKDEIIRDYDECMAEDQQMQAPQQAQQQQAAQAQQQITATAVQAKAAKDQAAAQRDATLAIKHQVDTQSTQLDNEWKAAMLRAGHNPNDASI